ncbi:hypothetical protein BC938DRAFT_480515 [Jimgerdemannia flammicorona]|uniref:Exonuclease domain-containing protein n=1 Tax=Jimgerdemannia flammicorona TaxID=994334 RepID=A0A433QIJ5_9FUNG|nr:hypothetical protein BC938DRAFT_480515 [Jimgerdemannia flammicorona]
MTKYSLFQDKSAAFITDGPFDIRDFITKQCAHSSIRRPTYFSLPWVDVRPLFRDNFNELALRNIEAMLDKLGLEFEGRQHSGLDDARNVGRIVKWLAEDGVVVKANRKWHGVMGPGRSADSVNGRKNGPWWKRK